MAKVERFEDLEAFKVARELARTVYSLTESGKFARDFVLRDQVRRAAVSILSNIAEGFERRTDREMHRFLRNSRGSCGELRAQLYVALDQNYLTHEQFLAASDLTGRIGRMLTNFMAYLQRSIKSESGK